ncbi:hypothetical protein [Salipiger sp.]|uniref:hypothetical protein n=1 Tax=Salipiger sp. TaxID=2078585 RepID=UPI003A97B22E
MAQTGIAQRLRIVALIAPMLLSACVIDREPALRAELSDTLMLRDTLYFRGRIGCSAALFSLYSRHPKPAVLRAGGIREALLLMRRGRVVAIEAGLSPNDVSRAVISQDLGRGLGLLSAGIAGAMDCLEPGLELPLYHALIDPGVVTVYDPVARVLMLVEWSEKRVWVLRSAL